MRSLHVREICSKLKQEIVARSVESRVLAAAARALCADERHRKHMERRAFGRCTRWRLLAYTWLRARPYALAEPHAVVPVEAYALRRVLGTFGIEVEDDALRRWVRGEAPGGVEAPAARSGHERTVVEEAPCAASSTS